MLPPPAPFNRDPPPSAHQSSSFSHKSSPSVVPDICPAQLHAGSSPTFHSMFKKVLYASGLGISTAFALPAPTESVTVGVVFASPRANTLLNRLMSDAVMSSTRKVTPASMASLFSATSSSSKGESQSESPEKSSHDGL